jgi:type II secretory pathway pseudopilin PulG
MSRSSGFSLIEVLILLVLIGLLLGGIMKGQELVTRVRVRNLILQQSDIKAACFGFMSRYGALPTAPPIAQ